MSFSKNSFKECSAEIFLHWMVVYKCCTHTPPPPTPPTNQCLGKDLWILNSVLFELSSQIYLENLQQNCVVLFLEGNKAHKKCYGDGSFLGTKRNQILLDGIRQQPQRQIECSGFVFSFDFCGNQHLCDPSECSSYTSLF